MITCPSCGAQNRPAAKFCQKCGGSFAPDRDPFLADASQAPTEGPFPAAPLAAGDVLQHPDSSLRRYGIITARELERSIYYDALALVCAKCHYVHVTLPEQGLCQHCQTPLEIVLIHERRHVLAAEAPSESLVTSMLRLSCGHLSILPHRDILSYAGRTFVVTQHPGRWRVVVRGKQPRSLGSVMSGAVHVGQALSYLHQNGFAFAEVGGSSLESLIVVGGGMHIKLADLSMVRPLPVDAPERAQGLINRDIAFLADLIFYLSTGKSLIRGGTAAAPSALWQLIERAMQSQYRDINGMMDELCDLPAELTRPLKPSHGQGTHSGRKYSLNEDSVVTFTYDKQQEGRCVPVGFYLVADGVGGGDAGGVASSTVNQIVTDWIINTQVLPDVNNTTRQLLDDSVPATLLCDALSRANQALVELGAACDAQVGTTVTSVLLIADVATLANVGDSRVYLLRDGVLEQVTQDHSFVSRLVAAGIITADEVRTHPQRNQIYRCLGCEPAVEIDTFTIKLSRGDRLVLCSDGLWEMVSDAEIFQVVARSRSPQQACDALLEAANSAGGEDNISVVVVEME